MELADFFDCSTYTLSRQKRYKACTGHYITTKALRELVLETIRTASTYAIANKDEFLEKVRAASQIRQQDAAKAVGRISAERFDSLLADYEAEQKELDASVSDAEARIASFEEDTARAEQFLELTKKYTDFSELTTPMINEFIEKIIVHAPEKVDGDRVQQVDIYLSFIGQFELPAPELSPEEEKKQEQLKRHRIKSRERYQQIKAGEHTVGQPYKCTCKCCGKEFDAKRSNAMYCSPSCQQKYYRQQAAKERSRECVCENCGKTFTTTRSDVKYCCEDCRYQAQIKRQGAKKAAKRAAEKGQTVPLPTERNEEISAAQDAAEEKSA